MFPAGEGSILMPVGYNQYDPASKVTGQRSGMQPRQRSQTSSGHGLVLTRRWGQVCDCLTGEQAACLDREQICDQTGNSDLLSLAVG